jgi:radical SAM protein with 4Fe4S-binding SPASM domain
MLFETFLTNTFYPSFELEGPSPFNTIELYLNGKCDQKCKYCYINKHHDDYFPEGTEDESRIMSNMLDLKYWMKSHRMNKVQITLFGGEVLSQDIGYKIIDLLITDFPIKTITIPSNMNFIFNREDEVQKLINKAKEYDKIINISASVDGLYMEENREIKSGTQRDEKFYENMFDFCSKNNFGFHPMIYSNKIEKWKDNFLWFQNEFIKYNISYNMLYLLEVRNKEWTEDQCTELGKFLDFLVKWTYNNIGEDIFMKTLNNNPLFNVLLSPFIEVNRGIFCSIQSMLCIRLGDLSIYPCHRLTYPDFMTAKYNSKNNLFEDHHSELGISIYGAEKKTFPVCASCPINNLCVGGCLGSQFEEMGDMFMPIPSVCRMEHYKVYSLIKAYKEIGLLSKIIKKVNIAKQEQIVILEREIFI